MSNKRKAGVGSKAGGRKKKKVDEEDEWFAGVATENDINAALLSRVYHITDQCQKKRHKIPCKDNPNCFEMLGQSELAAKTKELPNKLGPNPNENMRVEGFPVGLKNLGATCYMNSLVQSLFMNTTFRQGVYNWNGTETDDKLLFQLKNLFAHLQYSASRYHDPVSFLQSTEISSAVQQDVQEFFKMIITYIEEHSKSQMSALVETQFKGKIAYNTECKKCHTKSVKECEFYELELNVKGSKTIEDSLRTYVKEEEMTGQNQYFCSNCESLQDGGRSISIREPPCVLSVQLLRFVYDMQTYTKKKVRDSISFPMSIDLKPFIDSKPPPHTNGSNHTSSSKDSKTQNNLHPPKTEADADKMDIEAPPSDNGTTTTSDGEPPARATRSHSKPAPSPTPTAEATTAPEAEYIYELTSVMMHRGLTAYGGHYVVHVKDECTGKWWQFNDEDVRPIEEAKVGVIDDTVYDATPSSPAQSTPEGDGTPENPTVIPPSPSKRKGKAAKGKGKKAAKGKSKTKEGENDEDSGEGEKGKDKDTQEKGRISSTTAYMLTYARRGRSIVNNSAPEKPVVEAISKEMEGVKLGAQDYTKMLTAETDRLEARKLEFEEFQESITPEEGKPYNWISTEWLSNWIKCSPELAQIDNTKLVCEHNKVDPTKVGEMKRVSREVWDHLNAGQHQGGPTLTENEFCIECVFRICSDEKLSTTNNNQKRQLLEQLAENNTQEGFFISKEWFKEYSKNSPEDLEKSMTADLLCPHNNLTTNNKLLKLIPQKTYDFLRDMFPEGPMFPSSTEPCGECQVQDSEEKELDDRRKKERQTELKALREFYTKVKTRTSEPLTSESQYIVNYTWCMNWKLWLDTPDSDDTPGRIDNSSLLCPHNMLLYDPTSLAVDRLPNDAANLTIKTTPSGSSSSETSPTANGTAQKPNTNGNSTSTSTSTTSQTAPTTNGDKTVIDLSLPPPESLPFLVVKSKIWEYLSDKYSCSNEIKCTTKSCSPPVCMECLTSRKLQEAEDRLNYTDGYLFVQQGSSGDGKEAPPLQKRASTRYRLRDKNPKRKITPINAQKDTVQQLKLKIYEVLEVAPFQQAIWFGDTLLDNDSAPIGSYRIPLGADLTLVVVEGNQELLEENANKGQCEEGFKGSIFYSKPKDSPVPDAAPPDTAPALALSSDTTTDASMTTTTSTSTEPAKSDTLPTDTEMPQNDSTTSQTPNHHRHENKDINQPSNHNSQPLPNSLPTTSTDSTNSANTTSNSDVSSTRSGSFVDHDVVMLEANSPTISRSPPPSSVSHHPTS